MNHSDIYDPLSRINVPPSRHAVESDSEDDDDDQDYLEIDASGQDASQEDVQLQSLSTSEASLQGQKVIVLAGPVGEALSNYSAAVEVARFTWKGRPQASMAQQEGSPSTLLMLLYPSNVLMKRYSSLSAFLEHLLKQLKPTSLTLVSQYYPSLYNGSPSDDAAPIRFLSSQPSKAPPGVAPYSPPNYLWGTEASLLQAATLQSVSTDVLLVANHGPSLQPQNRLVRSTKRRRQVKPSVNPLADGGSMLADEPASSAGHHDGSLSAEFDDDELEEEEADPEPRLQDLDDGDIAALVDRINDVLGKSGSRPALTPAARASASSGQALAAFVRARRSQARRRRKDLGGMYI